MAWPANPFWDYALDLYRRAGVERACLELQGRHGLDVNLVLLCCWLGRRGIETDEAWMRAATAAVERWQAEVIRPLRAARGGLSGLAHEDAAAGLELGDGGKQTLANLGFGRRTAQGSALLACTLFGGRRRKLGDGRRGGHGLRIGTEALYRIDALLAQDLLHALDGVAFGVQQVANAA